MPLKIGASLPDFSGATEWLNGSAEDALALAAGGSPTLVHFWSQSCGLCKENLPRLTELRARVGQDAIRVIAVHMPRYPADTDVEGARAVAQEFGITEPCAVDNQHKLRDAFANDQGFVPAYYLFDGEGKLRSYAAGERGLQLVAAALDRLLARA